MSWALDGQVPARPACVVRPQTGAEVAAALAVCNDSRVPVTPSAGRSGVCGAAVPVPGGVVLDLCGLQGLVAVDEESLLIDVRAGTFGDVPEGARRGRHRLTLGPSPQS